MVVRCKVEQRDLNVHCSDQSIAADVKFEWFQEPCALEAKACRKESKGNLMKGLKGRVMPSDGIPLLLWPSGLANLCSTC
jgi:hypothetical protein